MKQMDACIYGRKVKKIFEVELKDIRDKYDIKQIDVEILMYFDENSDKTASDLYRELWLNKGQVSTGIDNLVKKQMLKADVNPSDRRYFKYELLNNGKEVVDEIKKCVDASYAIVMEGIPMEQQKIFFETGKKMCKNVDKYFE